MPNALPPDLVLPSEQNTRAIEAGLMFGRRTIWAVYVVAGLAGGGLFLRLHYHRTALLAPIDPNLHAFMIGLGVFIGVWLAAIEHDGWKLGIGKVRGGIPKGFFAWLCMAMMVAICGIGGHFAAGELVEWRAFHGLDPAGRDTVFTVVGRHTSRSGEWLDLSLAPDSAPISIVCSQDTWRALAVGDRIVLPVQTGRYGVQRAVLPALRDLQRG